MLHLQKFTFNPFSENTYVLYTDSGAAWLIDPGNSTAQENAQLLDFLQQKNIKPVKIILTHAHLDHVFGLQWAVETFKLPVHLHSLEKEILDRYVISAAMFGFQRNAISCENIMIGENDQLEMGGDVFGIIHVPGHSPGHIALYNMENNMLISGDVLFEGSIGRTDLYKGNHEQLLQSIREKIFVLPDDTQVFCGHGEATTVGFEKAHNPFF